MVLPETPVKPSRINPKILLLYGLPKVGKTEILSKLPGNLIGDAEDGAAYYECLRVPINKTEDLDELYDSIMAEGKKRAAAGKKGEDLFPYKYISLDTIDAIEDMASKSATAKYKKSVIGQKFEGESVIELPNGGGYYYLRKEVMEKILKISKVCKGLILVSHVKEKNLSKGGMDVSVRDISLTGKLSQIVCAKADAIGYVFRTQDGPLMINFETVDDAAIMGGRCHHLKGKTMEFKWEDIYLAD
jgi:hypothetical protein